MDYFLISILNGIVTGMLIFLLTSGLTIILSLMGVLNFAHAGFYMLGAYFAFALNRLIGFTGALILAPITVGLIGGLVERFGLRRLHRQGHIFELVFTFALVLIFEQAVAWIWGRSDVGYQIPDFFKFSLFSIGKFEFSAYRGFILAVAGAVLLSIYLVFSRTRLGLVIKAAIENPDMVSSLGHNVPFLFTLVFGGGCAIAALAGAIAGPILGTNPGMAFSMGPLVFVVVIIGGLGSLMGTFWASLLIGIMQSFVIASPGSFSSVLSSLGITDLSSGFMRDLSRISFSSLGPLAPYLLLIVFCLFRPAGILGDRDS